MGDSSGLRCHVHGSSIPEVPTVRLAIQVYITWSFTTPFKPFKYTAGEKAD